MTIVQFMIFYVCYLITGSIFIVGWRNISEGWIVTNPDGSRRTAGKVFKWFGLFIEKEVGMKRCYYRGEPLEEKLLLLKKTKPSIAAKIQLRQDDPEGWMALKEPLTDLEKDAITGILKCGLYVTEVTEWLMFYQDEPIYLFPEWFRMPMHSCIQCMSSIYGSILWWSVCWLQTGLFDWTDKILAAKLVFWIFYCISLTCVNIFVDKKTT